MPAKKRVRSDGGDQAGDGGPAQTQALKRARGHSHGDQQKAGTKRGRDRDDSAPPQAAAAPAPAPAEQGPPGAAAARTGTKRTREEAEQSDATSRVRVVGLPKRVTPEQLRKAFGACGEVTDCAVIRSKDEKRIPRMAFIGYKTPQQAADAVRRLNRSFLDTSRIGVEPARPAGSAALDGKRAWSRHTKARQEQTKKEEDAKKEALEQKDRKVREAEEAAASKRDLKKKEVEDRDVAAFLQVARGSQGKRMVWENDLELAAPAAAEDEDDDAGDDAEMESLDSAAEEERQRQLDDLDDMAFLKSKQAPAEKPKPSHPAPATSPAVAPAAPPAEETPEEQVLDTGRLYIRNVAFTATVDEVRSICEEFGPVVEVHIPMTRDTAQSKGVAFVQFAVPDHAVAAMRALKGRIFQGRLLAVEPGKANPYEKDEAAEAAKREKSSFKKAKAARDKADAGNVKRWNTLFMGGDAVATALAKRLDVGKDALVGKDTKDIAAKMALGEAQLVSEVKELFSDEGLDLSVLAGENRTRRRSDRIILVKNLAKDADTPDLVKLFGSFGAIERVVAPKEMTIALIEFVTAQEAKVAFRKLAFRPFNHVPLYLEWAPVGALRDKDQKPEVKEEKPAEDGDGGDIYAEQKTLYLTNIAFSVGVEDLRRYVRGCAGADQKHVQSVKLAMSDGRSKGFAFVQVTNSAAAGRVKRAIEETPLVQRTVTVAFSEQKQKQQGTRDRAVCPPDRDPLKLTVKNVPFEATKADIRKIFDAVSQVKAVRLPRKGTGAADGGGAKRPHRGFAFVEYVTAQEAARAMAALGNTHLYGRHLVIEYASSIDAAGHI
eukprot:TRINITY_DN6243_c2_g1_i1.p1 TRINITY_DN6243_c2_g1~~TRINITY_DN6243_c2_g1_i1.p1  ORF type:complete len:830 (+),score=257.37 TRINITY_DN6243_c2_g1_i1:55-2544(+)